MREIRLSNGAVALVDDEDYERISAHKWREMVSYGIHYAIRSMYDEEHRQHTITMHRQIMAAPADMVVDHKDRNGLNNQRGNLRLCTSGQNIRNQKSRGGYRGIYSNRRRWVARACINGKQQYLGSFPTPEAAALAWNKAIIEAGLGEFATLNDVKEA